MKPLADPRSQLSRIDYPFLRSPSRMTEACAGALPGAFEPVLATNPDKRPEPPTAGGIDTFAGLIEPWEMAVGNRYYRIVGDGSYPNGSFWAEVPIASESSVRRDFAVRNDWNGDHGQVVLLAKKPVKGWRGLVGPQYATGSDRQWLPGGAIQIWVPAGTLGDDDGDWFIEEVES